MRNLIAGMVVVAVLTPAGALACCGDAGGVKWWPDAVSRLAEQNGFDGPNAKRIYDGLITRPYDELFLYSGEDHPCDAFEHNNEPGCDGLSEEFFLKLVGYAMKYQEIEQQSRRNWWSTGAAIFSAVVSLLAFAVSIIAMRRTGVITS